MQRQRSQRRKAVNRSRRAPTQQLSLLRELVDLNRNQQLHGSPQVRDVMKFEVRRNKIYTFTEVVPRPDLAYGSVTGIGIGFNFQLSQLLNVGAYTALFDQYRFVQIQIQFSPDPGSTSTASMPYPTVYTAIDYDDSNAPISAAELSQYQTCQVNVANSYFERTLNPRATLGAYSGALTSYALAPTDMWFDVASPNIQYYGLKTWNEPHAGGSGIAFRTNCIYMVQFRNTH